MSLAGSWERQGASRQVLFAQSQAPASWKRGLGSSGFLKYFMLELNGFPNRSLGISQKF